MKPETWTAVDAYFVDQLLPSDHALEQALYDSDAADLPEINVAPNQGKLLMLIAQIHGAKTILEIGTLGGYSTIWLGRALPEDGRLITLELDPRHAEIAQKNIARASLTDQVEIRVGMAVEHMAKVVDEGHVFDLIFIDADKPSNPQYLEWSLKLTRPGGIIIVDNVVRNGRVGDPNNDDADVVGTRQLLEMVSANPNLEATAIQTVGSKGYDGFALLRVLGVIN